jgi:hypothetical protein
MKKLFLMGILACALTFGAREVYAQIVTLDTAITNVVDEFSYNFKRGDKVAILAVRCSSARMSKYIIEELTSAFVSQRIITIVGRAQLDQLQDDLRFQMFSEVNDSLAQTVGRRVGAKSVITGSFEPVGNYYRFRVRVMDVESANILVTYSANVQNDQAVASLMNRGTDSSSSSVAATSSQGNYGDFTAGQRWGTWALNAFTIPGLGSYFIMQDKVGLRTQLILGLGGPGLTLVTLGISAMVGDFTSAIIAGYCVWPALWAANGIYNIVRSASYHKPSSYVGALFDPSALNVVLLPAKDGSIDKVHFSYTLHF